MSEQQDTIVVHPGDIIQDADGLFYLVSETHGWGVGAVMRWREPRGSDLLEHYYRFKPGQFSVCGAAQMLPEAVAQARRDSLKMQAEIDRERSPKMTPIQRAALAYEMAQGNAIAASQGSVAASMEDIELERDFARAQLHELLLEATGMTPDDLRRALNL